MPLPVQSGPISHIEKDASIHEISETHLVVSEQNQTLAPVTPSHITPSQHSDQSNVLGRPVAITDISSTPEVWSSATKELLDAMPRAWTRGLLYLLMLFAIIIVPWSMLSQVDETGKARGQLEPLGKTLQLDAPVLGKVTQIMVNEGDLVSTGQTLVELDSVETRAEIDQIQVKKLGTQNRLVQLESLQNQLKLALRTQDQQNHVNALEKLTQVKQAQQELEFAIALEGLQKAEKLAQINQLQDSVKAAEATLSLSEIRMAAAQEKVPRYLEGYKQGVLSKDRYFEVEQLAQESVVSFEKAKADLSKTRSELHEKQSNYERTIQQSQSEMQQAQLRLEEHQRNYEGLKHSGKLASLKTVEQLKSLETEITKLQAETNQMDSQIRALEFQLQQRIIKSPASGIVFHRHVQSAGAVLQPGDKIIEIARDASALVLRAHMATAESESLRTGMPVKVKFDAYPFQDYGVVDGQVSWVSPDSDAKQTQQGDVETFELEIMLDQTHVESSTQRFNLTPGQTATAEVIIRQRRVIDFILDPFKKLQKSGLEL